MLITQQMLWLETHRNSTLRVPWDQWACAWPFIISSHLVQHDYSKYRASPACHAAPRLEVDRAYPSQLPRRDSCKEQPSRIQAVLDLHCLPDYLEKYGLTLPCLKYTLEKINSCMHEAEVLEILGFCLFSLYTLQKDIWVLFQCVSGRMSPGVWRLFTWVLRCRLQGKHKLQFSQACISTGKAGFGASHIDFSQIHISPMHMITRHFPIHPRSTERKGLCKRHAMLSKPGHNSMLLQPLASSAYLYIQIAPLTCFSAQTEQIAGCDLLKRENESRYVNSASTARHEGTGRNKE